MLFLFLVTAAAATSTTTSTTTAAAAASPTTTTTAAAAAAATNATTTFTTTATTTTTTTVCITATYIATSDGIFWQTVGDAISDLLLVETILARRGWSAADWDAMYTDLPNRQIKIKVRA